MWGPSVGPHTQRPQNLPLLTISRPVQCTRKSASLEFCTSLSSRRCHSLRRLAMPLLANSTVLAARTAAVFKRQGHIKEGYLEQGVGMLPLWFFLSGVRTWRS